MISGNPTANIDFLNLPPLDGITTARNWEEDDTVPNAIADFSMHAF